MNIGYFYSKFSNVYVPKTWKVYCTENLYMLRFFVVVKEGVQEGLTIVVCTILHITRKPSQ